MNDETIKNNIPGEVLAKIKAGEISMRPKNYFIFQLCLLIGVLFLIVVTSTFLISYILFSLKAGGQLFLLSFGTRGLYQFLTAFPWFLLCINALLLLFLDWLLKSFRFGYNSPIIYLFLATLFISTFLGWLINFTSVHSALMHRAEDKHLPFGGGFYSGLGKSHSNKGMFQGEVVAIEGKNFFLRHDDYDINGGIHVMKVSLGADIDISGLEVGDEVFVAGDLVNNEIIAYGLHKLPK